MKLCFEYGIDRRLAYRSVSISVVSRPLLHGKIRMMTNQVAMHVRCVARVLDLRETVLADCEVFIKCCSILSIAKAKVGPDFRFKI